MRAFLDHGRFFAVRFTPLLAAGALAVLSCSHEPTAPDDSDALSVLSPLDLPKGLIEPGEMPLPTADGWDQSVHPDIVEFDKPWNGYRQWHVSTPYPYSDRNLENPSIYASQSDRALETPLGLRNPVVAGLNSKTDYNSDPDLVYDNATHALVMLYRQVKDGFNNLLTISSNDGISWSTPSLLLREPNHSAVSPTIIPADGRRRAMLWYVDAGQKGCSATSTKVVLHRGDSRTASLASTKWSGRIVTDLEQPGYVVWHMKARYIPSKREYWAIYAAYPADTLGCSGDDLFLARSTDGVHWLTYPEPLMRHEERAWTREALYRSTFLYDAGQDRLRIWLSARGADHKWRLGYTSFTYEKLQKRLSGRAPRALGNRVPGPDPFTAVARPRWTEAP